MTPEDRFFFQPDCDRCGKKLVVRTMSWFTHETICSECSDEENAILKELREKGVKTTMVEGIGYVPDEKALEELVEAVLVKRAIAKGLEDKPN